jgi:Rps23 Pro-64 3,4-dihydroxylase Tpa1-like proline 4-hydroxylase
VSIVNKLSRFLEGSLAGRRLLGAELLDWSLLNAGVDNWSRQYANNQPFPHIVIDNFIDADKVRLLLRDFPEAAQPMQRRLKTAHLADGRAAQINKRSYSDNEAGISIKQILWELHAGAFIDWLERLTGTHALLPDPKLNGAGMHVTDPGGLLRVHADYNRHPIYNLDRRINLLLYLNINWREEYGGHLELWDRQMTRCEHRISPIAGRCVIFSTSTYSFHGHPHPLTSPEGVSRKSIALYYYSNGRPFSEQTDPHATLWQELPQERSPDLAKDTK